MQIVCELGSCFQPGRPETLLDAAKAAMDCGADCVKLQVYDAEELARRRGCGEERLAPWAMNMKQFRSLAEALRAAEIPFGASVFGGVGANMVMSHLGDMAFLKTATQEYQCASLAERASAYACAASVPLYVSVPPDACLVVGNYWSPKPIAWFACVPHYPSDAKDYRKEHLERMLGTLPGKFGVSDHTPNNVLLHKFVKHFAGNIVAWERHFCYDDALRDKVLDGGPWSLDPKAFTKFVKEARASCSAT